MRIERLTALLQVEGLDRELASRLDVIVTENELCDRLAEAEAGASITYYVGLLARDRDRLASSLLPERRAELNAIADRAWRFAEAGWGYLVQRRVGEVCFAYLLVVRRRPLSARSQRARCLPALVLAEAA